MEWEYVDITMLRVLTHKDTTRDQISKYLSFLQSHWVIKLIHLEPAEMLDVAPELQKLDNVVNISSTPMTTRNGTWNVLVKTCIQSTEMLAVDLILKNVRRNMPRKWIKGSF